MGSYREPGGLKCRSTVVAGPRVAVVCSDYGARLQLALSGRGTERPNPRPTVSRDKF